MQFSYILVAALVGLVAVPASAATKSFDITVQNTGTAPLTCDASIAHWYSDRLGEIAPGATLRFSLQAEPETGAVYLRNAKGDNMPVERLWCGRKGRSWVTRAEIAFDRRAGRMPETITLNCAATDRGTDCARP